MTPMLIVAGAIVGTLAIGLVVLVLLAVVVLRPPPQRPLVEQRKLMEGGE